MSKLMIQNARLAFPQLWTPARVNGEGEPAFSGAFLIAPTHPAVKMLEKAFLEVATEKWGAKAQSVLKAIKATDKTCLHDGDTKSQYEGFPGMMFISARSKVRPLVIDRDRTPLAQEDGTIYSGCYVNAQIELWAQDNKFGKRINAQLRGVQFFGPGDAFAGGGSAADAEEFGDLSTEESDTDPTA